jgi:hypothetical protein
MGMNPNMMMQYNNSGMNNMGNMGNMGMNNKPDPFKNLF